MAPAAAVLEAARAINPILAQQRIIGNKAIQRQLRSVTTRDRPPSARQHLLGNQAMQRMVRTGTLPPSLLLAHQPPLGNQAMQRLLRSYAIQAALTVTPPGDVYEQEAAPPMQLPSVEHEEAAPVQTDPLAIPPWPAVQRHDEDEEEAAIGTLQARVPAGQFPAVAPASAPALQRQHPEQVPAEAAGHEPEGQRPRSMGPAAGDGSLAIAAPVANPHLARQPRASPRHGEPIAAGPVARDQQAVATGAAGATRPGTPAPRTSAPAGTIQRQPQRQRAGPGVDDTILGTSRPPSQAELAALPSERLFDLYASGEVVTAAIESIIRRNLDRKAWQRRGGHHLEYFQRYIQELERRLLQPQRELRHLGPGFRERAMAEQQAISRRCQWLQDAVAHRLRERTRRRLTREVIDATDRSNAPSEAEVQATELGRYAASIDRLALQYSGPNLTSGLAAWDTFINNESVGATSERLELFFEFHRLLQERLIVFDDRLGRFRANVRGQPGFDAMWSDEWLRARFTVAFDNQVRQLDDLEALALAIAAVMAALPLMIPGAPPGARRALGGPTPRPGTAPRVRRPVTTPSRGRGGAQPTRARRGTTPRGTSPRVPPSRVIDQATTTHIQELRDDGFVRHGVSNDGRILYYRHADTGAIAEVHLRQGGPVWLSPRWGRNRVERELRARGFRLERPTRGEGGHLYRNGQTGEEIRVMPRPSTRYRDEPIEKHLNDYYYRYRTGPDQPWGAHTTIPNRG